jgi:hypothetical protein
MTDTATGTPDASTAPQGEGSGTPAATPPADAGKPTDSGKAPKWDGEFDAERAARLVENLREENNRLKAAASKVDPSSKSAEDRLAALEERAAKAERALLVASAAKKHGIPDDLVSFLSESTEEALDRQAEALAKYAKKPADDVPGKPRPALKPGTGSPDETASFDAAKVAAAIRRR